MHIFILTTKEVVHYDGTPLASNDATDKRSNIVYMRSAFLALCCEVRGPVRLLFVSWNSFFSSWINAEITLQASVNHCINRGDALDLLKVGQ